MNQNQIMEISKLSLQAGVPVHSVPFFIKKLFYSLILIVTLQLTLSQNAYAYLDPGTGSYVFQVLIATFIGGLFTIKMHWQKIKNSIINFFSKKPQK